MKKKLFPEMSKDDITIFASPKTMPLFANGVKPKQKDPRDWQFSMTPQARITERMLPSSHSIQDKMPSVYLQSCNDCTTAAVLACNAYYYSSKSRPSEKFTYYNQKVLEGDEPFEDDGSTVEYAIKAVRKYGVCKYRFWPDDKPFDKKPTREAYNNGLLGKEITKFYNVNTLLQLKKALYSGYPVVGATTWCFKDYDNNFIMNTPTKKEINNTSYGHAIVFVAYDDAKKLIKFRNSWGEQWAEHGYGYLTYDVLKKVIWWDDTYAITK